MEKSWKRSITTMNIQQYRIAQKLWELSKDLARHKIENEYGIYTSDEFYEKGEYLFGMAF